MYTVVGLYINLWESVKYREFQAFHLDNSDFTWTIRNLLGIPSIPLGQLGL
jgi:hypothetical protein